MRLAPVLRALVGPLCALAAAAVLVPTALAGAVPGQAEGPVDGIHSVFYYEVAARRLVGEGNLGRIEEMWFPLGRPLLLAQQNVLDAVLAAPLLAALGPGAGTGWFVVFTVASNALAGAWLGGRVSGDVVSRLAGGLALGFCPFTWDELQFGRYTQAWLAPTAVAAGLAWTAADGRPRQAALAGFALAAVGYHYWFYGLFAAVVVAGVMLGRGGWRGLKQLAIVAVTSACCVAPFVVYVATSWTAVPGAGTPPHFAPATRPLAGLPGFDEPGVYVPQLLVLAALAALLVPGRRAAAGALAAGGYLFALALGEFVTLGGTRLATPYHYLVQLPFFDRFWWPQRALGAVTVAAVVPLSLLACSGRWGAGLVALASVIGAAQSVWSPGLPERWSVPAEPLWHRKLPPGAVLFVPMLAPREGQELFRCWPTHHRPLVNGMSMWTLDLWPADYRAWFHAQPLLAALYATERGGRGTATPADAALLAAEGVVGIVAQWDNVRPAERVVLEAALGPGTAAGRERVWSISPAAR